MEAVQLVYGLGALSALLGAGVVVFAAQLARQKKQEQQLLEQGRELEQQLHGKELELSTLNAQLQAASEQQQRLQTELQQQQQTRQEVQDRLEQARNDHHAADKHQQATQVENQGLREQIQDLQTRLNQSQQELKELQASHQTLANQHTELTTTLEQKELHFAEQMQQLSDTRKSLGQEFENLANKIFEEKGKTFTSTSQSSIDNMLKPFREQIEGFQKRINEVHDASLKGNTSLSEEIKKVLDIGLQMSSEASNLTSALKGDSQQRGAWGEAQLRRTLEMSGLLEDAHYETQSSFRDADGRHKQTDYLIKLPDGKHIIIDSKVTLNAYDRAVSAESPEEYQLAMAEHVKAVRRHIDDLAGKDYTNLVGMRSPNFVLMFMPIEPAYIEALKHNKDLFEYGYKKGIVLVSHTTLIPILRTVSNLWMIERSNVEAREISDRAGDIYNQVCVVAERLSKLGGTLTTVSNHYNSTVTALVGQQGLHGKVERFNQLSTKVSKSMPELEPAELEFASQRLSLIVEPLPEIAVDNVDADSPATAAKEQGDL